MRVARFGLFCCMVGMLAVVLSDIRLDDETAYLARGVDFLGRGEAIEASFGPLYSLYLGVIDLATKDKVTTYYVNVFLLASLFPWLSYSFLRRLDVSRSSAELTSVVLGVSNANIYLFPKVGIFASVLLAIVFILGQSIKVHETRIVLLSCGLLISSYARAELAISFWLFCLAWTAWLICISRHKRHGYAYGLLIVCITALVMNMTFGSPLAGGRSYLAFSDHYQVGLTEDLDGKNPFRNGVLVTQSVFGEADNIMSAAVKNPQAFLKHVVRNGSKVPESFASLVAPFGILSVGIVLGSGIFLGGVLFIKKKIDGRRLWGREVNSTMSAFYWGSVLFTVGASCLAIYPREHYIVLLIYPLAYQFATLVDSQDWLGFRRLRNHAIRIAMILVGSLLLIAASMPILPKRNQLILRKLQTMRPGIISASSRGLSTYLTDEWSEAPFEPDFRDSENMSFSCLQYWKKTGIRYLIIDRHLLGSDYVQRSDCLALLKSRINDQASRLSEEKSVSILRIDDLGNIYIVGRLTKEDLDSEFKRFARSLINSRRL